MSPKGHHLSFKAGLAALLYLVIPVCCLLVIMRSYPELSKGWLYMRMYWILPSASAVIILAQVSARARKGETRRFVLNIAFTVATLTWVYGLLGGGVVITTQWNGYDFSLHMENYVTLIACVAALNVIYYTLEWRVYHTTSVLSNRKKKQVV
jgi:hypothetical protein